MTVLLIVTVIFQTVINLRMLLIGDQEIEENRIN